MRALAALVILLIAGSLHAQLFTPESFRGAALGGLIGGVVGHNTDGKSAEWAAVGAGAGWLLGTMEHESRNRAYRSGSPEYPAQNRTHRPNYALTGAAVGGLTGGIVGHNTDGRSAEWAAVGAGAGLLLGAVAEENARRGESPMETPPPSRSRPPAASTATPESSPQKAAPSQPTVIVPTHTSSRPSPMASANRLFGR